MHQGAWEFTHSGMCVFHCQVSVPVIGSQELQPERVKRLEVLHHILLLLAKFYREISYYCN